MQNSVIFSQIARFLANSGLTATHAMNTSPAPSPTLDLIPVWNGNRVRQLIDASRAPGGPAFLQVGRRQKAALMLHLRHAFGKRTELDNSNLYYMGLRVMEVQAENFLAVTGSRRPVLRPRADDVLDQPSRWGFTVGR